MCLVFTTVLYLFDRSPSYIDFYRPHQLLSVGRFADLTALYLLSSDGRHAQGFGSLVQPIWYAYLGRDFLDCGLGGDGFRVCWLIEAIRGRRGEDAGTEGTKRRRGKERGSKR